MDGFVSRDRARRLGSRVAEVLQERRLAWRGGEAGLETLVDRGEELMARAVDDAEESARDVAESRVRDRERPFMDVPFAAAAESVASRLRIARQVERARLRKRLPDEEARRAFQDLLESASRRIDAFCAAYDEKRPMGPARPVEVARVLERVEEAANLRLRGRGVEAAAPAYDARPPPVSTDAAGLEDLLLAARDVLPEVRGPWRVRRDRSDGFLDLALGADARGAPPAEVPGPLRRAADVLRFLHPVEVACAGAGDAPAGVRVRLADAAAADLSALVAAATSGSGRLSPDAERAVRALLRAPPPPEAGAPPPARLVAILGVLRVLDAEIERVLAPRLASSAARAAAGRVPREPTRKAPPRKEFLASLERRFPGFPAHRVDAFAEDLAKGRLPPRGPTATDAAIALALVARPWVSAGARSDRAFALGDLTDAEVDDLVRDLVDLAAVRKNLEAGLAVPPVDLTRLERAAVAILGRLGRA